jgi:hypothetical protein
MSHRPSAPTRSLPARPSLERLRKQAKGLLKAYRAGDAAVVAEVERFESQPNPETFALAVTSDHCRRHVFIVSNVWVCRPLKK